MKKLFILFLFIVTIPFVASAQETITVDVSTTIQDAIALTKVSDLTFGTVQAGDVVSVNAVTNSLSNAGSTATRGTITSTATIATVYTVSGLNFNANVIELPYVSGGGVSPAPFVSVTLNYAINSDTPVSYTLGTSTNATTATENTFYIGGTFTAPSGDSVGALYSGSLTVSVVYL